MVALEAPLDVGMEPLDLVDSEAVVVEEAIRERRIAVPASAGRGIDESCTSCT